MEKISNCEKLLISARYWLLGMAEHDREYFEVLEVMEFCRAHHSGERNGGQPEFIHQLGIFHELRTQHKHLKNPKLVYMLAFAHDVIEDPSQTTGEWVQPSELLRWGEVFHDKVLKMSKKIFGIPNVEYSLTAIFEDEDCGPAKGADRVNNVSTMVGIFKPERLQRYVKETADEFLPRLKIARRKFPHQEAVYESIKLQLVNQLQLIDHIVGLTEEQA